MQTDYVTSPDGTKIAYSRLGSGPPLVMIHCVGVSRATTMQPTLPGALAEHFTVYTYDRRGKGESGNTQPYAPEREFEDLTAIIEVAGGTADVYGFSSGGTLALLAAEAGVPIQRMALLEAPLSPEPDPAFRLRDEAQARVDADVAAANRWYATDIVGVPADVLAELPPPGAEDLSNARTIVHELTFLPGTPATRFAGVTQPTVYLASDQTDPVMYEFAAQLSAAMPALTSRVLPGEWHGVHDGALAAAIREFLVGEVPAKTSAHGAEPRM